MPVWSAMRARSRCIRSASESAAPVPNFFESTSIFSAPVCVSTAHRSKRSFSSGRLRSEVSQRPSGDSFSRRGAGPDSGGLPKMRSSVSFCWAMAGGASDNTATAATRVRIMRAGLA